MAYPSKYSGKCKDCGTEYDKGDMIDTNGNQSPNKNGEMKDHWCPNGKNCQGSNQIPAFIPQTLRSTTQESKRTAENMRKQYFQMYPNTDDFQSNNWTEVGESQAKRVIGVYIGVLEACESMGITEPPVIGMIFKNTMMRLLKE